jgi:hypothetical protein
MPQTTLRDLGRRVELLEQEVLRLRQLLGVSPVPAGGAAPPVDLDAALDQVLDAAGIKGELSGLARLRALQAEQERLWAKRRPKRSTSPSPPR